MKQYYKGLLVLFAASGIVFSKNPEPVCGLPQISRIAPDTPLILHKTVGELAGDRQFMIRQDVTSSSASFIQIDCDLKYSDNEFEIYVEVAEWDSGHVDLTAIDTLIAYFRDYTPQGSVNPDSGIKAIAETTFGDPPDIDDNGKLYILLVDVRDGYISGESDTYVAGYFDPADQTYGGNHADIIYLDTNPGILAGGDIETQIGTLAHEYQHLIHFGSDENEETWIDEGLSELSTALMGLPHRDYTYYIVNTNTRLDEFNNLLADYARSGLFLIYSWVQLGNDFVRELVANPDQGIPAFESTLNHVGGPGFNDHVYNWHLANFLQTTGTYGYGTIGSIPQPQMHDVIISFPANGVGSNVARLGATWTLVTGGHDLDLYAHRNSGEPSLTLLNGDEQAIITTLPFTGASFQDPDFGYTYSDLVVLATTSANITDSAYYALYITAEGGFEEVVLEYDGDQGPDDETPWINLGISESEGEAAVLFDIEDEEAELLAVHFLAFNSEPVTVRVYQQSLIAYNIIHTAPIDAPLAMEWTTHWLPHDLTGNRVFVSVSSVDNALAYNENDSISYSYYQVPPTLPVFFPLNQLSVTLPDGELKDLVGNWLIRLSYMVLDSTGGGIEIPSIAGYFYPNPFNPGSSNQPIVRLWIHPGNAAEIRLYNILGREIWRGTRVAGEVDPVEWQGVMSDGRLAPSGLYIARITADEVVEYRKLVLIR